MNKRYIFLLALPMMLTSISGCKKSSDFFTYEKISFVDKIGDRTNSEAHDYDGIKVNKTEVDLRKDFAFGVDASMVKVVEENGGVYYNDKGQEQEVFQILRRNGVNFVRFRLWNNPYNKFKDPYGGGNNDVNTDIELAKRAKEANMNVMIDFHYSDFWADPDRQNIPRDWGKYLQDEIPAQIEAFTKETLQQFKSAGVTVDAVQIGNETNNGLCGYAINWNDTETSFDYMAKMFSAGIKGAKAVNKKVKTMIHLANGGNTAEFENYFTALDKRKVAYDMIGASFYPHLSGSLEDLQTNLNNVSQKTGKPVIIAETSWGFTDDYVVKTSTGEYKTYQAGQGMNPGDVIMTANSYSSDDEDIGGYLTGEQAQATMLRDVCNVLSKVPKQRGLGIFYWEPGWLPVDKACWATAAGQSYQYVGNDSKRTAYEDGLATWSNQGLFSYTGKMLSSLKTFSYIREGHNQTEEKSISGRNSSIEVTINLAANETLPKTAKVVTDFEAIRDAGVVWEEAAINAVKSKGVHSGLKGVVDGKYPITATANCIENFIVDPGFENQGEDDFIKDPWKLEYVTPNGEKVAKLDRKKDIRSGKTDLNWYHSTKDFSFKVSQTINNLPAGTYTLRTYIMGIKITEIAHTKLDLFISINGGEPIVLSLATADYLAGWSAGYKECVISDLAIPQGAQVKVGLEGAAKAGAWAHNDDWELVNNN